jgi:hypothetical protein
VDYQFKPSALPKPVVVSSNRARRTGKKQEIETLINEEALLFGMYLRNEKKDWIPRMGIT